MDTRSEETTEEILREQLDESLERTYDLQAATFRLLVELKLEEK